MENKTTLKKLTDVTMVESYDDRFWVAWDSEGCAYSLYLDGYGCPKHPTVWLRDVQYDMFVEIKEDK